MTPPSVSDGASIWQPWPRANWSFAARLGPRSRRRPRRCNPRIHPRRTDRPSERRSAGRSRRSRRHVPERRRAHRESQQATRITLNRGSQPPQHRCERAGNPAQAHRRPALPVRRRITTGVWAQAQRHPVRVSARHEPWPPPFVRAHLRLPSGDWLERPADQRTHPRSSKPSVRREPLELRRIPSSRSSSAAWRRSCARAAGR
jgi:hypothetical protein